MYNALGVCVCVSHTFAVSHHGCHGYSNAMRPARYNLLKIDLCLKHVICHNTTRCEIDTRFVLRIRKLETKESVD
jgi:hypothetical protein